MKKFTILLILTVLLSGCAKTPKPVESVSESAKESISALVAVKPECKDVGAVCKSHIDSVVATCDLEVENLNKDVIKWKWAFWGLISVLGVFLIKRAVRLW